jgi:hypothetical protein
MNREIRTIFNYVTSGNYGLSSTALPIYRNKKLTFELELIN